MEYLQESDDYEDDYNSPANRIIRNAIKAKPEYELRAMLSLHKSESLKKLARSYRMKKYASSKKDAMIDYICGKLGDLDLVETLLLFTNDKEYDFFEEVALSDKLMLRAPEASCKPYHLLRSLYFLEIYNFSGYITFVVPDRVKDIFLKLHNTSFPSLRKRYSMLDVFAKAFTTIYGVIDLNYYIDFCNNQLKTDMGFIELVSILLKFAQVRQAPYTIFGDFLIHSKIDEHTVYTDIDDDVVEESNEAFDKIESMREAIPMKELPLEELLKYADSDYYEHTSAHERLSSFLEEHDPEIKEYPIILQLIMRELNKTLTQTDNDEIDIPCVDMRTYESDKKIMRTYQNLMRDVDRHTRKWSKNGWMAVELENDGD